MRELRTILILISGLTLIVLTYKSKYEVSFPASVIWAISILIGIILSIWTVIKDIINYREERSLSNFLLTIICFVILGTILTMEYQIQSTFHKPTLVKAYYDGDINGTGIDFKIDGTYIFENYAVGMVDYKYGTFKLVGTIFTLDKNEIDKVIETDKLILSDTGKNKEKFLLQIDKTGQVINTATEFKVIADNR